MFINLIEIMSKQRIIKKRKAEIADPVQYKWRERHPILQRNKINMKQRELEKLEIEVTGYEEPNFRKAYFVQNTER